MPASASGIPTPSTRTERSTLYFDAPSSPSSPDDRESMSNPMDQNGGGGMVLPIAPGSVLSAAGYGKQMAVPEVPGEGGNGVLEYGDGAKNPFNSQQTEAESPGWLPAVDNNNNPNNHDLNNTKLYTANGGGNAHMYGAGVGQTNAGPVNRSNSVSPAKRPPVPVRPNSFIINGNNPNSRIKNNQITGIAGVGTGMYDGANNGDFGNGGTLGHARGSSIAGSMGRNDLLAQPQPQQPNANGTILDGGVFTGEPASQQDSAYDPRTSYIAPADPVAGGGDSTHQSLHAREQSADAALTPKQRSQIAKVQRSESKRLSKILKKESKVEKQTLAVKMSELEELIKLQKDAVKREAKAHHSHSSVLSSFQKEATSFHTLRQKYEAAQARLASSEQNVGNAQKYLEEAQESVRDVEERVRAKRTEVEGFKEERNVGEKERLVKMGTLKGVVPAQGVGSPLRNETGTPTESQAQAPPMKDVGSPGRKSGRKLGIWK
ncbi:hypothetical protein EYR36_008894 [Pleurotus pulmonarius]|nr:hypothetical protein EYR36_008894 [Pleurotus pulmonarius]